MNKKLIWGVVIVIVLILAAVATQKGYVKHFITWIKDSQDQNYGRVCCVTQPSLKEDSTIINTDWITYTDKVYGFTLKYPPSWTLEEVVESPLPNQKRTSLAFRNYHSNLILFSVVLNDKGGYTVTNPTPYTIPQESQGAYNVVLSTIKLK